MDVLITRLIPLHSVHHHYLIFPDLPPPRSKQPFAAILRIKTHPPHRPTLRALAGANSASAEVGRTSSDPNIIHSFKAIAFLEI